MAAHAHREERRHETLTHVLAVIGAGGALVGWVALVGAMCEYARFKAAGIPSPARTVSLLPRETLLASGLSVLLPTLAIALGLGLLAYVAMRMFVHPFGYKRTHPRVARREARMASIVVGVAIVVGWVAFGVADGWGWVEPVLALALAALAYVSFRFGLLRGSPIAAATTVFAVTVVNGGAAAFIQPLVTSEGKFDTVLVTRRGLEPVTGFYLTRSGGHVYVLVFPAAKNHAEHGKRFSILAVPESEVELVEIGPSYKLLHGRPVEHKAKVTKLPDPVGPTIYVEGSKGGATFGASSSTTNYRNTTTTVNSTTTNNSNTKNSNSHNTTITTTTVYNQVSPTPLPELVSVIQLFALDEVVPATDHFCFAVGASNVRESLRLRFYAPTMPAVSRAFAPVQTTTAPRHGRQLLIVPLSPAVSTRLRRGTRLPVNVRVTATSPGRAESQTAYHLELQQPGRAPRPHGPSWEKAPDFASCAGARPAPNGG
jgi:hypothetical protein